MVGKTVAQKLNLFDKQAINTYRSYPFDRMGKVSPHLPPATVILLSSRGEERMMVTHCWRRIPLKL